MQKLDLAVGSFLAAFFLFPAFCSGQTISIVSGNGQLVCVNCATFCVNCATGGLTTQFAPLVVQVNDATGKAVANTTVTWTDTQPDGQTTTETALTNNNGQATYTVKSQGVTTGPYFFPITVVASAFNASVSFTETAGLAGEGAQAPVTISLIPNELPQPLTGDVGTTAAVPIVVSVVGTGGITGTGVGLPGIQVRLQPGTNSPTVSCATQPGQPQGTVLTNSAGTANCYPAFGDQIGTGTYTIVVGGNFFTFPAGSLTVAAGPPAMIKYVSGNNQKVNPGVKTPQALIAEVTDVGGNPSNQAAVKWSVNAGAATLSSVVSSSGSNGQVSAYVTPTAGPVQVTVALAGNSSVQYTFTVNVNVVVTALQAVSGSGQQAKPGEIFADPLIVQVNDNGAAVAGVAVTYTLTSGSATFSPDSAAAATNCTSSATSCSVTTSGNGQAPVIVMAGATSGPVVITASIASGGTTYTQTFDLTVLPPAQVTAVVNAAGFDNAPLAASPCSLVTIYGTGLANGLQGVVVPFIAPQTQVAGVTVQFGGVAAPILYVANLDGVESVSAQVPCEVPASSTVPPATVPMVVTVDGTVFPTFPVAVTPISPGIFQFMDSDGKIRAVLVRQDGSFISVANPARPGDIVRMFVTGLGQTTPPLFTDEFEPLTDQNGTWVPQDLPVNVKTIVGVNNSGVQVLSAQYAFGMVGVYEVDFQVPENTPLGNNAPFAIAVYQNNNTTLQFGNPSLIPIQ